VRLALVLGLAECVAQFLDYGVLDLKFAALDSDTHLSVFGVVSLLGLALAALAVLLLLGSRVSGRARE
jgi:hypothetical protein